MLRNSTLLLTLLLVLSYATIAADSWLHGTSEATTIDDLKPLASGAPSNFGRVINTTLCDPPDNGRVLLPPERQSCGLTGPPTMASAPLTRVEGIRVMTNSSTLHQVVFADDGTAVIVPQDLSKNVTYTATSVGVKAECKRYVFTLLR